MDRDPFDLVGDTLDGQFRVVAFAGEGDLSVVYRGHHIGVDAVVAIKCLNLPTTLDGALVRPLVESFREASRLHYKLARGNLNIAQGIASGTTLAPATGMIVPYLVREWFEGESLQSELARRRGEGRKGRTLEETVALLDPVADAVAHAHSQGALHLSLNPSNLFVAVRGDRRSLKVLDFGVSRAMNDLVHEIPPGSRPEGGLRVLFPAYAAPEQLDATLGKVGGATDVYALALLMMELLSDRVVIAGQDTGSLVKQVLDERRRPTPRVHGLELPRSVDLVLTRAVALSPDSRHKNAKDFWDDVKTSLRVRAPSRPAPVTIPTPTPTTVAPAPARPPPKATIPFGFDPHAALPVPAAPPVPVAPTAREPLQAPVHVVATPPPPHPSAPPLPPVIVTVDSPLPLPAPFVPPPAAPPPAPFPMPPLAPREPTFILEDPPPPRSRRAFVFVLSALIGGSLGVAVIFLWRRSILPPVVVQTAPSGVSPADAPSAPASVSWPTVSPTASTASAGSSGAPSSTPSSPSGAVLPFFPVGPAKAALDAASHDLGRCKLGKVWGIASANVTFGTDGTVSHVAVGIPFTGTTTGQCVADTLAAAKVQPFAGKPAVVSYKFFIPGK